MKGKPYKVELSCAREERDGRKRKSISSPGVSIPKCFALPQKHTKESNLARPARSQGRGTKVPTNFKLPLLHLAEVPWHVPTLHNCTAHKSGRTPSWYWLISKVFCWILRLFAHTGQDFWVSITGLLFQEENLEDAIINGISCFLNSSYWQEKRAKRRGRKKRGRGGERGKKEAKKEENNFLSMLPRFLIYQLVHRYRTWTFLEEKDII